MTKKALVIDGNSLMYRMFYATKKLSDFAIENNLFPINAVKLMLETCLKLRKHNYDYCLIAFDHGKKTFRHNEFDQYKSGRKSMPTELVKQIPLIKEGLELIGLKHFSLENYEADDLIGNFTNLMTKNKIHVDIYTSDKDMLQLVNNNVYVHLLKTGITNIIINTLDNFKHLNNGLLPNQIPDYKAIVGDKSDNIPGIKGIGEKMGIELLLKYNHLENIYLNLNDLSVINQNKFKTYYNDALMYKQIATININVDNEIFNNINNFIIHPMKINELKVFLNKYKIRNIDKYLDINEQINLF